MNNPKCPYCGGEQYLTIEDHRVLGRMEYYMCIQCGSRSPVKKTIEEAYAAAMKRDRVKGEWINEDVDWICSICGHDAYTEGDYRQVRTNFCPNCGADMRKEVNDE